jgi:hypothetical protein
MGWSLVQESYRVSKYIHVITETPKAALCSRLELQENELWQKRMKWLCYYHHHHHHVAIKELDHLLTRSGLTHPEVFRSSLVPFAFYDVLFKSIWVICYVGFDLHVSIFSCNLEFCLQLGLYVIPLQSVYLFCNLSKRTKLSPNIRGSFLDKLRRKRNTTLLEEKILLH